MYFLATSWMHLASLSKLQETFSQPVYQCERTLTVRIELKTHKQIYIYIINIKFPLNYY